MRRLLNADAAQWHDAEPGWPDRVAAFEDAGRQLAFLAADGRLTRGLRSILAHHLIFAFNRAGIPSRVQAAAAWLAIQAAFGDDGPAGAFTARSAAATPTIGRMETVITTTTPDPVQLRAAMVGSLTAAGHLRTPEIITAFTETERHLFLPGTGLAAAYGSDAVPVKHGGDGEMISCISAPSMSPPSWSSSASALVTMSSKPARPRDTTLPSLPGWPARPDTCGPSTSMKTSSAAPPRT